MFRSASIALLLTLITTLLSCAGSNPITDPPAGQKPGSVTSVFVTPSGIGEVWQGTQVQFKAQVIGINNQHVSWTVLEGASGGSVDNTGLYTAPSRAGTFHVVATSEADPNASGTASVEVPAVTVSIFPAAETLRVDGQRQFSGFAVAADQNVTWKLQEGSTAGNITANGLYTAPSLPGTFHLIATAVFNTNLSSTAPITIVTTGFVQASDMETGRFGHTATLILDGRVLISGGTTDPNHSAELFVPASSSFSPTSGGMVYVRTGHCAALLPDGKVLIAAGTDANGTPIKTAELFDPSTESFTATGELSEGRADATATLLPDGKVLIAGGKDGGVTPLSTAELYDPVSGKFSLTGNMNSARSGHTATLLANGKVLLVGSDNEAASGELFDPATGKFAATGALIQPRAHHTATLLPNGRVLVLGGTHTKVPEGGGAAPTPFSLDSAEVYDPTSGVFQSAGNLLIARDSQSATLLANGTVLVAAGYSHGSDGDAQPEWNTMSVAELFDPSTSISTTAASLETDRAEHVATMLNNGEVLISGGIAGYQELCCDPKPRTVTLASTELYK